MRRREFIRLLVLAALLPDGVHGDDTARVTVLGPAEEPRFSHMVAGFKRGLGEHGHADARLMFLAEKVTRGDQAGARAAAERIVQGGARVAFIIGSELTRLARQVAPDIPIVFVTPGDPVGAGLAISLNRPGGNLTAITFEFPELSAKRLELLKSLRSQVRRVLVLYDPSDASPRQGIAYARDAARALDLALVEREAQSSGDIDRALAAMSEVDAVLAIPGGFPSAHYARVIREANARGIATLFPTRTDATADALVTYGAKDDEVARDAARLVDKILRGAKAGELPIERPEKLRLVINLKTARNLGLEVSPMLLALADEVVE